jgi:RNA polymerase sigma-70 factor, ECF subfamily
MADAWKILQSDGPALYGLLARLTVRGDVAADLMQELFLKLSGSAGFRSATNGGAYARRVAINLAMDWRRTRRRQTRIGPIVDEPLDKGPEPSHGAEEADEVEQILVVVGGLGELTRGAFVLRYVQGESYARVGEILGKTTQQARGLCHAAVKQVRDKLQEREANHERNERKTDSAPDEDPCGHIVCGKRG